MGVGRCPKYWAHRGNVYERSRGEWGAGFQVCGHQRGNLRESGCFWDVIVCIPWDLRQTATFSSHVNFKPYSFHLPSRKMSGNSYPLIFHLRKIGWTSMVTLMWFGLFFLWWSNTSPEFPVKECLVFMDFGEILLYVWYLVYRSGPKAEAGAHQRNHRRCKRNVERVQGSEHTSGEIH